MAHMEQRRLTIMEIEKKETIAGENNLVIESYSPAQGPAPKSPLLFVGGVFDGSWIFERHARRLASHGRAVHAVNLRGQYKTRCARVAALTHEDYLADIAAAATALRLTDYILAGYSMGGALALKYAEMTAGRKESPAALVLYDPTYPRETAETVGEKPPRAPRLAPAMHFIPPKSVVEEMLDEPVLHGAYLRMAELFRNTYASAKAYRAIELDKLPVSLEKIKIPALILAVDKKNPAFAALAGALKASLFFFEGYSHGSFLTSRYYEPVAAAVERWLDGDAKTGAGEKYNWHLDSAFEGGSHKMRLHYYTSWENPTVEIYSSGGKSAASVAMLESERGRFDGENIFEAEFNFKRTNSFIIKNAGAAAARNHGAAQNKPDTDKPAPNRNYAPLLPDLWLLDGKFYQTRPDKLSPPRYLSKFFESHAMKQKFAVHIRLPRNYDPARKYPAAVLNDGQNQYKGWGMHGGWHTDATLEYLNEIGRAPDTVLIAVESPQRRRNETYLAPPIGRADLYINFLADELLPALRKEFAVTSDPAATAVIGASYGANNSVYAGLFRPDTFGLVGSLSFAYLPKCPVRADMRDRQKLPFSRLYADCGTKWADDQPRRDDSTPSTKDLVEIAKSKGMVENENLLGLIFSGHYHNETFWRKRIGLCLEFLFAPRP